MDEQRRNWIVNTSVLYEFIACSSLPLQPLAVDFLTLDHEISNPAATSVVNVACGLEKEEESDVSIYILEVEDFRQFQPLQVALPSEPLPQAQRRFSQCIDYQGFPLPPEFKEPMFQCVATAKLDADVNRVLWSRRDESKALLAAKAKNVYIYDNNWDVEGEKQYLLELKGHQSEGYGLAFSKCNPHIASCSEDGLALVWDLNTGKSSYKYQHQQGALNCVCYSLKAPNSIILAAESGHVIVVDTRTRSKGKLSPKGECAHNAIATSPQNPMLFASGATNGIIYLWDQRNMSEPVHSIQAHKEPITRLQFCPFKPFLLASSSEDGQVCVFDLDAPGRDEDDDNVQEDDQDEETEDPSGDTQDKSPQAATSQHVNVNVDEDDGDDDDVAPELIFNHTAHQSHVYDLAWCTDCKYATPRLAILNLYTFGKWYVALVKLEMMPPD